MATHDTEIVDGIPKELSHLIKASYQEDQVLGTYIE